MFSSLFASVISIRWTHSARCNLCPTVAAERTNPNPDIRIVEIAMMWMDTDRLRRLTYSSIASEDAHHLANLANGITLDRLS